MTKQWHVVWDERALKELKKIDKQAQNDIIQYVKSRIATQESPRLFGISLVGNKAGLWRYHSNDYRLICHIEDGNLAVLVLRANHRKNVYE
jgi:mRNA interferase RelE/StbE